MRLQNKIPLYVVATMLIVGIAGIWPVITVQKNASINQFEETASALTTTILSGLEEDMLRQDADHIQQTLDKLSVEGTVRDIEIVGVDGAVWASTDTGRIGTTIGDETLEVVRGESESKVFGEPSDEYMTAAEVVPAKEACLDCHGTTAVAPNQQGNLGAIRASISTESLNNSLELSRLLMISVGAAAFILVTATLVLLLRRTVLTPLTKLTEAAGRISRGDFSARAELGHAENEIGAVSTAFNQMVGKVEERTRDLVSANAELEEASRLKSEFLANMSHELRTPLNVIIGFSEVLRDTPTGELDDRERDEFCENIISSGYHLLELINEVLDLAKVEAGRMEIEPKEFYVGPVLKETISTMQPLAAKKGVDLSVNISDNLTTVYADDNKFKQIFYNLLSNAVKFTPEGGSVQVTGAVMGTMARFNVTDTGIGIAPADQDTIFSEFKQVDGSWSRQFEGSGLGLALTKKFVEMMHGQIWVESELGRGSSFYFTLPLPARRTLPPSAPADRELKTVAPDSPADVSGKVGKPVPAEDEMPLVLVVEDDRRTADLIGLWLANDGYRVDFAADGDDAVKKVKELAPFAVCLDIMLPKRDGWQVLHQIKSNPATADTGVVICSALDNPGLGFALGAADYCVKPLSRRHLLDKLRHLQEVVPLKRSKPQVLVADDDDEAAAATIASLERQGFHALRTSDGEQTMSVAVEHNPDIIILDYLIPGDNCYDVVSFLQSHPVTVDIPIIVTSAARLTSEEEQRLGNCVNRVVCGEGSGRDQLMSELFRLEKLQPERARLVDRQTGLFNRRYFEKRLAEEFNRARRYKYDLSALLVSIDRRTADPREHAAMVGSLARLLRSNVRSADPLARYDANRFSILLPETPAEAGYKAARKIVEVVRGAEFRDAVGKPYRITVSVAATGYRPAEDGRIEELVGRLEKTLAEIAERGGNAATLI